MKRKIYHELVDWKHSPDRKPLILKGARQVGKTYILDAFANNEYDDYIEINFDENLRWLAF
ncbi:unnamed protein product [marine sediment metagenome]|uniref:AAA domain-containing protein n=1 Tax=marine sediment metagenome TaxID=412755 RepID=X1BMJ8_9ZZZZ